MLVHIRLDDDLVGAIDARAKSEGRTRTNMVARILATELSVDVFNHTMKKKPRITNGEIEKIPLKRTSVDLGSYGRIDVAGAVADTAPEGERGAPDAEVVARGDAEPAQVHADAGENSKTHSRGNGMCEHGRDRKHCRIGTCAGTE